MRLISHKFCDLIKLEVERGRLAPNAAIIGTSGRRFQPKTVRPLFCMQNAAATAFYFAICRARLRPLQISETRR
ncbi:hypothetical protein A8H26_21240 [Pluralibacter gergoviae]|nr:hypothetical protein A8H26_21240 [Pluralibacter gergoviae]